VSGLTPLLLVTGTAAVAGTARRRGWPAPLLLVGAGLAASLLPGLPDYRLDPNVVLYLLMPPLLFGAAWQSSMASLRRNRRAIGLLAVGLVLFTTLVVGAVAHLASAQLSVGAGLTLGAIVAPPDSVAAVAIGRTARMPRQLVVILAGESLLNDAVALTAYRAAVAATTGAFSLLAGAAEFLLTALSGAALGVALAWLGRRLLAALTDPVLENAAILAVPFLGYALAQPLHASGELAVVVAGLMLGHRTTRDQSAATRLQGVMIWRLVEFLLESVVFALIGLQLTTVLEEMAGRPVAGLLGLAAATLGAVVASRLAWMYPAVYLPYWLSARVRRRDRPPPWTFPAVLSWAGMRGVVSMVAAFALPAGFPERDLIRLLTFAVVIGTLLVHGLTLPAVIRRLGVTGQETAADALAEAAAQHDASTAALRRLDALLTAAGPVPDAVVRRLRELAETRRRSAWERLGGARPRPAGETPSAAYRRVRRAMLDAERAVFIELRNTRRIDEAVLRRVQFELDLEEAMLARE
jgi:CPA1 family monovalent cation:H+ antiporter